MKTLGIVLLIVGLFLTLFSGFTLITQRSVFNVGRLEIDRSEKTPVYWSPAAGIAMMASGAVFYVAGKRKSRR